MPPKQSSPSNQASTSAGTELHDRGSQSVSAVSRFFQHGESKKRHRIAEKKLRPGTTSEQAQKEAGFNKRRYGHGQVSGVQITVSSNSVDHMAQRSSLISSGIEMRHIDGTSLVHHQAFKSIKELLQFFIRITCEVKKLADLGIVHRDIKPANIIVKPNGKPKLVDFGSSENINDPCSRKVCSEEDRTKRFSHFPPEHFGVGNYLASTAEDVYGLGELFNCLGEELSSGYEDLKNDLMDLVRQMKADDSADRPCLNEVLASLSLLLLRDHVELERERLRPENPRPMKLNCYQFWLDHFNATRANPNLSDLLNLCALISGQSRSNAFVQFFSGEPQSWVDFSDSLAPCVKVYPKLFDSIHDQMEAAGLQGLYLSVFGANLNYEALAKVISQGGNYDARYQALSPSSPGGSSALRVLDC